MSTVDELPGVIFNKKSSQLFGTTKKGVKRVEVILEAEVRDDAVWSSVEPKLDGLKIYTADDFKGEMLNALREDFMRLEQEHKALLAAHARMKVENATMQSALSVLNHQLEQ